MVAQPFCKVKNYFQMLRNDFNQVFNSLSLVVYRIITGSGTMSDKEAENKEENDDASPVYPVMEPEYLQFTKSLIEGAHVDLPNPYYKHQQQMLSEKDDYAHPTEHMIRSLVTQYGPFETITEERLIQMINSELMTDDQTDTLTVPNTTNDGDSMDVEMENTEESDLNHQIEEARKKEAEFFQKRNAILQYVRTALGSSTMTLDFISLLLSSVRQAAASSSMSSQLKQNMKLGSLSCDRITISDQEFEKKRNLDDANAKKIGHGWKLQSLQESSRLLKSTVSKLSTDLEKDNIYWKEVLNVFHQNELITSVVTPKTFKKELAIKYGYGDSGSNYFDNGIALLKKGKEGHLEFEKFNTNEREKIWSGEKVVSVKIFKFSKSKDSNSDTLNESQQLIGQSDSYGILKKETSLNDNSFISKIKNSRFFIFENELFWSLIKEATTLVNVHVKIVDNHIRIELHDKVVQIESLNINSPELTQPTPELPENDRADDIIKFFKIMLCANNYKNTQELSLPPVALSKETLSRNKHAVLIRPMMMYTRHNQLIKKFKEILASLLLEVGETKDNAMKIIENDLVTEKYINDPNKSTSESITLEKCYNNDPFIRTNPKMAPVSVLSLQYNNLKILIELTSSYSTLHITMNVKVIKTDVNETVIESSYHSKRDVATCLSWVLKQYK